MMTREDADKKIEAFGVELDSLAKRHGIETVSYACGIDCEEGFALGMSSWGRKTRIATCISQQMEYYLKRSERDGALEHGERGAEQG